MPKKRIQGANAESPNPSLNDKKSAIKKAIRDLARQEVADGLYDKIPAVKDEESAKP